jgi:hypothetical protein
LGQRLLRAFENDRAERAFEKRVSVREKLRGGGVSIGEIFPHPDGLRTLSGK